MFGTVEFQIWTRQLFLRNIFWRIQSTIYDTELQNSNLKTSDLRLCGEKRAFRGKKPIAADSQYSSAKAKWPLIIDKLIFFG